MTGVETASISKEEAFARAGSIRVRLDKMEVDLRMLADDVRDFHAARGWLALGLTSWQECCEEKLGMTKRRANQLVHYASALRILEDSAGVNLAATVAEPDVRPLSMPQVAVVAEEIEDAVKGTRKTTRPAAAATVVRKGAGTVERPPAEPADGGWEHVPTSPPKSSNRTEKRPSLAKVAAHKSGVGAGDPGRALVKELVARRPSEIAAVLTAAEADALARWAAQVRRLAGPGPQRNDRVVTMFKGDQ